MLAGLQRLADQGVGRFGAGEAFEHHIHVRIRHQALAVVGEIGKILEFRQNEHCLHVQSIHRVHKFFDAFSHGSIS